MTVALLRNLAFVVRFTAVDLAHELRRDYERGVFSRRTLAMVGSSSAIGVVTLARGELGLALLALTWAAIVIYCPARADRRWRDELRNEP